MLAANDGHEAHEVQSKHNSGKPSAHPRKKRVFSASVAPMPKKQFPTPTAKDIKVGADWSAEPPKKVLQVLGAGGLMIGVDIETNDWKNTSGAKGGLGQFGFYTRCDSLDYDARIVQLGWVIHDDVPDAIKPLVQERIVKPEDFEISKKATTYHGIAQARATEYGQPLRSVLEDFMQDVASACARGGRIVVHHLEFDCGIIDHELARAGLDH